MYKIESWERINHPTFKPCILVTCACSSSNDEYMSAKIVKIIRPDGAIRAITKFEMHKTRQCFNTKPIRPIVAAFEDVSDNFLKIGNEVIFEF